MSTCSTHVLDAVLGAPASALPVSLLDGAGDVVATASTDGDGRVRFDADLDGGTHRLVFDTGSWFARQELDTFYPEVTVTFTVDPGEPHYHVAVLLGPYSYTTYRGS